MSGGGIVTRSYILATAGHVDHGKSALVRALTGTDPDRLPEEKARGITIDLGFAHLDVPGPQRDGRPTNLRLAIVDVPGHEDFVKNMVAGVGSIDLALFVIAADDGWMPQTEEHFQILTYLGVRRAVVALTKIDLVESEAAVREVIAKKLAGTPFANAPILGTSVANGHGIEKLRAALQEALTDAPPRPDIGKPRLAVDRAFSLRGVGTVVTGTLIGGSLKKGQPVLAQPSGATAKIRTLQSHGREVETGAPGTRVALNLPDLAVAPRGDFHDAGTIGRGDVVSVAGLGPAHDTLDVALERSARAVGNDKGAGRTLADQTRLRLHHGSDTVCARLVLIGRAELPAGARACAQLRLDRPIFAFAGDRFILRDWAEQHTLAGGTILDPLAARTGTRSDARRAYLRELDAAGGHVDATLALHLARLHAAPISSLLARSNFSAAEIAGAVQRVVSQGKAIVAGSAVAESDWWERLRRRAMAAIDAEHQSRPERDGLALTDLRQALAAELKAAANVFDALVADLTQSGFVRTGAALRSAAHHPALPPHLQPAGAKIRAALNARPLDPPSRKELAPDKISFQALKFLLNTGEAIEVGEDLVLHAAHYRQAMHSISEHLRLSGAATVSELRQSLNTSRRVMVPLLEKLDREGITVRQGDKRVLRSKS